MNLYECHITVQREHAAAAAAAAAAVAEQQHWKFSQIDGDPVLGKKVFAYLTTHDKSWTRIFERMQSVSRALAFQGVPIVREKIELILYDTKTGVM